MESCKKKVTACAVAAVLGGFASSAISGGFSIGTQNGSGTGNAFAGGAASAEEASTIWYNPAGMSMLPNTTNYAVAASAVKPSFKFQNTGSTIPSVFGTGDGGDGGGWHLIPQGYISHKLNSQWSIGAAFNTPFGLATDYDNGWLGQTTAVSSEVKTYNLNVAASYKVNDMLSVGAGVNYQRAEIMFNSYFPAPVPAAARGAVQASLSDNATGWNVGALFRPTQQTRIGAHYRSAINYTASGTFYAPPAVGGTTLAQAGLTTPDSFSFSVFHTLDPRWDVMGDVTWTGWSHLKQLDVVRTTGPLAGRTATSLPFNWDDTMRYSLGANYKYDDGWKFRFGVAFDQTPSNDTFRTARLPDQDRTWAALGAQWKMSKTALLDFGYAHEFIKDASVNQPSLAAGRLIGSFNNQADILSIQFSQSF